MSEREPPPDPEDRKEERRAEAKRLAGEITPERLEELREAYPSVSPLGKTRRAPRPWSGTRDAVSMPIQSDYKADPFMKGDSNDFLFPVGAGKTEQVDGSVPRQLRIGGWIYLRADSKLVARACFIGVEQRPSRREHIASPEGRLDRGPGQVLAVDPNSWEKVDVDLTSTSEMGNGYRYYDVTDDGPVFAPVSG
jgi:hypothetical protein